MNFLYNTVLVFNNYLGNYILVVLLIGVGILYTIKTRFIQIRCFKEGFKYLFSKKKKNEGKNISPFQALATAIGAQVGTGNIVGASGAILTGGPGAIFWMWIIAFLGMSTIYAEATLAISTRIRDNDNNIHGGPVYYINKAFPNKLGKFLSVFFSISIIFALGFMGCMVQSNSISSTLSSSFSIPSWSIGLFLFLICLYVFIGNTERIVKVSEIIVPIMSLIFLLGCIVVFFFDLKKLAEGFTLIFRYAFSPEAIIGGSFGSAIKIAISQGVKRGLFSNEAGMGSTPHAHALADVESPHQMGCIAMVGVFLDTFVVLTINALVIISRLYTEGGILNNGIIPQTVNKTNLSQLAFTTVFGEKFGSMFVSFSLFFFAFSTIISWNYFGRVNVSYLFGVNKSKKAIKLYLILASIMIFLGSVMSNEFVWEMQDALNNFMVVPNVIALFVLYKVVVDISNKYSYNKKKVYSHT